MIWRVFIVLALLVVALASLLTGRRAQDVSSPTVQVQPPQPGYYMKHARIVEMGPDGKPLYQVEAERLRRGSDRQRRKDGRSQTRRIYSVEAHDWTLPPLRTGSYRRAHARSTWRAIVKIVGQPQITSPSAVVRLLGSALDTETHIATTRQRWTSSGDRGASAPWG